ARPIGPWIGSVDLPVRSRRGSDRYRGIAKGDEMRFEVPRQRVDWSGHPVALGGRVGARSRLPAAVGGLRPAVTPVEREVDARDANPLDPVPAGRELRRGIPRASLFVDEVIRAGDNDVWLVCIDRDRGLVLMVSRHGAPEAPDV